ncbi:MAG: molybdopterin-guanine dinucleotide biosynthesis protein B [Caldiserica bacterium]|nr:molybdopterin-guanine dinucleotide biosynthesis protein B [Caldisericota bacterium]
MKVVAFVGHKGVGKTRLICELIPVLRARGYRVGTAKHVSPEVEPDAPGTDTHRHRLAGAERVLLYSERHAALFWDHGGTGVPDFLEKFLGDLDIVILEGFKGGPYPKIEVYRTGEPLAGKIPVAAVVSSRPVVVPDGVRLIPPDPEAIADFIETEIPGVAPG